LKDPKQEAAALRLTYAKADAGRRFDILVNGHVLANVTLTGDAAGDFYTVDYPIPAALRDAAQGLLNVRFVAQAGSLAGGLYGLRLLR
jgi:hypothetical protein